MGWEMFIPLVAKIGLDLALDVFETIQKHPTVTPEAIQVLRQRNAERSLHKAVDEAMARP